MTDTVNPPPQVGEGWWRVQPTSTKADLLKPYFDTDGYLTPVQQRKRNLVIAELFQIHPSSVAWQRVRYLRQKAVAKQERVEKRAAKIEARTLRKKEQFLIDLPPQEPIRFQIGEPQNKGLSWWGSLGPDEKRAAIVPLVEAGMSSAQISRHLELETRNRVVSVRDRFTHPKRIRGVGSGRPRILKPKRVMWSLGPDPKFHTPILVIIS